MVLTEGEANQGREKPKTRQFAWGKGNASSTEGNWQDP